MESLLFKMGIPTYIYSVETALDASTNQKVGEDFPTNMGRVYGISVSVNGSSALDSTKPYITVAESALLWINFRLSQSVYINSYRLDNLVYINPTAGTIGFNPERYYKCNIPGETDLKQSFFQNPTGLTGKTVCFNFHYIDIIGYNRLVENKMVFGSKMSEKIR